MSIRQSAIALLQLLLKELESLSDAEAEALAIGELRERMLGRRRKQPAKGGSVKARLSSDDIRKVTADLSSSASREDARKVLDSAKGSLTRANLEQVARALNVHVNKHDKRDAIVDKIVETAVGVRLRSEAIRGVSLKESS